MRHSMKKCISLLLLLVMLLSMIPLSAHAFGTEARPGNAASGKKAGSLLVGVTRGENAGATAGAVTVTARWETGTFPEGTKLSVTDAGKNKALSMAEAAGITAVDGAAVDIAFIDPDGNTVQPAEGKTVDISFELDRRLEGGRFTVLHEAAPAATPSRRMLMKSAAPAASVETVEATASATAASFSGASFSVYAIVGEEYEDDPQQYPRATYEFYLNGSKVDTQIVRDGETLYEPSVPDTAEHKSFVGWRVQDKTDCIDFSSPVSVTGPTDVTLHVDAVFDSQYKVIFHIDREKTAIFAQEAAPDGTAVSTAGHALANTETAKFEGWYLEGDTTETLVTVVTLDKADVNLLPKFTEGLWVYFESRGGSYVDPVFTTDGQVREPTSPTNPGYSFQGWDTSETSARDLIEDDKVSFPLNVTQSQTLYAGWQPLKVPYTLLIWAENENDDGFTIYQTIDNRTELVGTVLGTDRYADDTTILPKYSGIPCFFLDTALTDAAVCSVKGDGTSVRNVYYRRYRFTLGFYQDGELMFKLEDIKYREYFYDDLLALMSEYPGEIKGNSWQRSWLDTWKFIDGIHAARFLRCEAWEYGVGLWNSFFNRYKNNNGIIHWDRATGGTCTDTFNEYHEWLDDATTPAGAEIVTIDGIKYYNVYSKGPYLNQGCNFEVSRPGFSFVKAYRGGTEISISTVGADTWNIWHVPNNTYDFYFHRKNYTLSFDEEGLSSHSLKYEELITAYNPSEYVIDQTEKQEGLKRMVFKGWYDNERCLGQPVDFSTTRMPAGDLMLYAKWEVISFPVTFDPANGDDPWTVTVESGEAVDKPADPEKQGTVFVGWKKQDGTFFSFRTLIEHETVLTAVYQGIDDSYTVAYDPSPFGTFGKTDPNHYSDGAMALVIGAPTVTDDSKIFVGWRVGQNRGAGLKPGDSFEIDAAKAVDGVITLYAQYADKPGLTTLTYDPNGGQGAVYTDTNIGINNDTTPVKAPESLGIKPIPGYAFVAWNTEPGGGGDSFRPTETVALNLGSDRILYAQWKQVLIDITVEKIWDDNNDRSGKRPDSVTVTLSGSDGSSYDAKLFGRAGQAPAGDDPGWYESKAWTATFVNLPTHKDGVPITYTVSEDRVDGYKEPVIRGSAKAGFTVTNGIKTSGGSPFTGDNRAWLPWLGALVLSAAALGVDAVVRKRRKSKE